MKIWLFVSVVCAAGWCYAQPVALPDDPWADASVYRDEWGVPHVRAGSLESMAFAFGYAQAQDQLTTLLRAYRIANGRAAEVWGEAFADYDARALQLRHADLAKTAFDTVSQDTRDLCSGFAKGVNAWMVEHRDALPAWAEGVAPHDPLALLHFFLMAQARLDLREPAVLAPVAETGNAWAVGPAKSASGRALLAASPHTYYTGPFQWYEAHLTTPHYDVYGATLCGLPLILQGHNGTLAWALTPNQADSADIYVEPMPRFRPEPGSVGQTKVPPPALLIEFLGGDIRSYLVKTAAGFETRHIPVATREQGPVVAFHGASAFVWRAAGYGDFAALHQLLAMGQAQDTDTFLAAMAQRHLPSFHVICADSDGTIAYLYNTAAPAARVAGRDGTELLRPLEPAVWRTITLDPVPFAELPLVRNPASGFVQACGNPPEGATTGIADLAVLPPGIVTDRDTHRAQRARDLLSAPQLAAHDALAMLFDTYAPVAALVIPQLQQLAAEAQRIHPDAGAILGLLGQWDGRATTSSTAMTAFHVWWSHFAARAQQAYPSPTTLHGLLREGSADLRPFMLAALVDAARTLRNDFGALEKPWGEVHRLPRGDRSEAVGGALSGEPLFLMSDLHAASDHWQALYGPAFAMVVELSDPPRAMTIVPFGGSDDPASPHFDDQMDLFLDGRMKTAWFTAEAVQRQAVEARGKALFFAPPGWAGEIAAVADQPVTVKVATALAPPVPLPVGTAAFSVYAGLSWEPATAPLSVSVRAEAPSGSIAQPAAMQLWVCRDGQAWEPMAAPGEAGVATLTGGDATFAHLGSEAARQAAALDTPAAPLPEPVLVPARPVVAPPAAQEAPTAPGHDLDAAPKAVFIPGRRSDREPIEFRLPASDLPAESPIAETGSTANRVVITEIPPDLARTDNAAPAQRPLTGEALRQMRWGAEITLETPWGAIFALTARERIGARIVHESAEHGPVPDGLAPYSPVVTVQHTAGAGVVTGVAVSMPVASEVCSPEALRKAALYAYSAESGWRQMTGQRLNAATRTFSALDSYPGTYAVLGPAEGRSAAPAAAR